MDVRRRRQRQMGIGDRTKSVSVFAVHGGFSTTENSLRGSRGGSRGSSRDGSRPVFRRALRILGDGEFSAGLEGMLEGKLQGWLEAGFSPCTEDSRRRRILCGALGEALGEAPGMARGWFSQCIDDARRRRILAVFTVHRGHSRMMCPGCLPPLQTANKHKH